MIEQKEKKTPEEVAASPVLNKTSTVVKHFLPDYVRGLQDPLWEVEENGLTYRYGYGLARLSVTIDGITNGAGNLIGPNGKVKLYYHQDYLGTVDYLTSDLTGKITSWTKYNEWGEITHNAVLKCGQRQLDLVKNYTGHDYDQVIGLYYAKNRIYDPENRRFTQIDPVKDGDNWYAYVGNNPVNRWDPLGLEIEWDRDYLRQSDYAIIKALTALYIEFMDRGDVIKAEAMHYQAQSIRLKPQYMQAHLDERFEVNAYNYKYYCKASSLYVKIESLTEQTLAKHGGPATPGQNVLNYGSLAIPDGGVGATLFGIQFFMTHIAKDEDFVMRKGLKAGDIAVYVGRGASGTRNAGLGIQFFIRGSEIYYEFDHIIYQNIL